MENVIRVENFGKNFAGKVVHKDINLEVKKGECLVLLGGSGAGKSVILRSLIGLEKPDKGSIFVDDIDVTNFTEEELIPIRKKIAYVFQGGALFDSMSIFDNLAYPLREHTDMTDKQIHDRVHLLLNEFGLGGNDKLLPAELSGGMQKRVGLARSIILKPEVILYDEPTAGLDPLNTKKIQEIIITLKSRGNTSILVTHDMPTAFAVGDRMALVQNGEVVSVMSVNEINATSNTPLHEFIQGMVA